jgi:hypothetical protein
MVGIPVGPVLLLSCATAGYSRPVTSGSGPSEENKLLSCVKHICLLSSWWPLHMLEKFSFQLGVQPEELPLSFARYQPFVSSRCERKKA